jgi:hypothetical protein
VIGHERASSEIGTALIEMVVVGFVSVALLIPVITASVRLADAHGLVSTAAHDGATWYARHGEQPPAASADVEATYVLDDHRVEVMATTTVEVMSVFGAQITVRVTDRAVAPVSPFRSSPHRNTRDRTSP